MISVYMCIFSNFVSILPKLSMNLIHFSNYPINCNETLRLDMDLNKWHDESHKLNVPITEATIEEAIEIAMQEIKQRRKRERQIIRESINLHFSTLLLL